MTGRSRSPDVVRRPVSGPNRHYESLFMRIASVVGARPQFVKSAVVSRELANAGIEETIIHTGQHYDEELSAVFFDELGIPEPAINLEVGSATHALQTGDVMIRLEAFLSAGRPPDCLLVFGDTNTTLGAALVASKLNVPLAHVEAGLRSFNRTMPEEINRIVTDRLSALLFCPTRTAVDNLLAEGITEGVHLSGDVMLDATILFADLADERRGKDAYAPGEYYVATIHRAENTDDAQRLASIFEGFGRIDAPVVLPLHPRTRGCLGGVDVPANVEIVAPLGYLSMLSLVKRARGVLTDSGGLQKEAVWLGVPCVTLRDETEWIETTERGWNQVVGADADRIAEAAATPPQPPPPIFTERGAAKRIAAVLANSSHPG